MTVVRRDADFLVGFPATESAQVLLALLPTGPLREASLMLRTQGTASGINCGGN